MSLPGSIKANPQLERWIAFNADGTITVRTGKVEIGQGIKTAIAIIAAEELDVALSRIRVETADTRSSPEEGFTSGSMSIQDSGHAVRVAAATARQLLLVRAAEALGVDANTLSVDDGTISAATTNKQADYWELAGAQPLRMTISVPPPLKTVDAYTVTGSAVTRLDLPAKLTGEAAYVHDIRLPGMQHGRLIKPPTADSRLVDSPEDIGIPGVRVACLAA